MREYINIVKEGFDLHRLDPEAANRFDKLMHALIAAYEVHAKRAPEEFGDEDPKDHAEFFLQHLCGDGPHHLEIQAPERMALKRLGIDPAPLAILDWIEGAPQIADAAIVAPTLSPILAPVPAAGMLAGSRLA